MAATTRLERWLYRLRGPEASPVVLVQRRVFILPTRTGLAYAGLLFLMLIGAINYGLSLGFALVFLLVGLGLVAMLHTFRNLLGLEISAGRAEPVFAGDRARFVLHLRNRRRGGRLALCLGLDGEAASCTDLAAEAVADIGLGLAARRRGWLRPGRIRVETRYPLGLVRAWSLVEPNMRCLVYPRPEAVAPPLPPAGSDAFGEARGSQDEEDFAGLRDYRPGDSPSRMAWKAAARGQSPLTKLFDGVGGGPLWLDWNSLPGGMETEARLSRLTRWLLDAQTRGLACGLRLPGREIPLGRDARHFESCLEALALHGESSA